MPTASPQRVAHQGGRGEPPNEPSRFFLTFAPKLAHWAGWPLEDVAQSVDATRAYLGELNRRIALRDDKRTPRSTREALDYESSLTQLARRRDAALSSLEPIVEAGLERREGQFLRPPAIVRAEAAADWLAWRSICLLLAPLLVRTDAAGNVMTRHLCVCKHCTHVFRPPGRKKTAGACPLCRHLPAQLPPALGTSGRLSERGDRICIPVPVMAEGSRSWVVGWGTTTLGLCVECGAPCHGRSDQLTCAGAHRSKRNRRSRSSLK